MGKERSEADKRTTELRAQADEVQLKVSPSPDVASSPLAVPFCSSSRCERVPSTPIIIHNVTSLNLPLFFRI